MFRSNSLEPVNFCICKNFTIVGTPLNLSWAIDRHCEN